jgi:hypothetical protein
MDTQPLVKRLVEKELSLTPTALPVDEPKNVAYLRGTRLRLEDLAEASKLPYNLGSSERMEPKSLLGRAIDVMAPGAKGKFGDELRKAVKEAEFDRRPLWAQGFWNILARTKSNEAYLFTQEAGGYDTTQLNWNAADTVVLNADFRPGVTFWRIEEGFDAVPRQLVDRFVKSKRGELHLEHRLRSLSDATLDDGTPGMALTFDDVEKHSTLEVRARDVILAMPRRSLEMVDDSGPVFGDPAFQRLLKTVTPIPLFKCFVAYDRPWWDEARHVSSGRSVTDLPLRQVYYWSSSPGEPSVLLATYDDTLNVSFWRGLAADEGRYELDPAQIADAPTRTRVMASMRSMAEPAGMEPRVRRPIIGLPHGSQWDVWKAPTALTDEVHRQLTEMHDVATSRRPYAAVYRDWSEDPFGGGVNFWNIGQRSWDNIPRMAQPVDGYPVYVCGEAYSDTQGWVEGALHSAEIVCERLGLPPIGW